jgi:uncharacterized repeat protein (TIGR03803 family)
MANPAQHSTLLSCSSLRGAVLALICALGMVATQQAQGQTYTVLYSFTGGADGGNPFAGLTMDAAGHLYGTAATGGAGYGTAFELRRAGRGWVLVPLYTFAGGNDGATPYGRVIIGGNGTLYGSTVYGGGSSRCVAGCGTVFNLRTPALTCSRVLCPWTENVLHAFQGIFLNDGVAPIGGLAFDPTGTLLGVTLGGGLRGKGTVYELTPSNGGWTENVLHDFRGGGNDGERPYAGVVVDHVGNLYGTTQNGGRYDGGTAYQLTHTASGWVESIMHSFLQVTDGAHPAGLIMDTAGNLYGGTSGGGQHGTGTVFELSSSNGNWTFTVLFSLPVEGSGVFGALTIDGANNLYGTTGSNAFKLTRSNDGWTYTNLYTFTGGSAGTFPNGSLVLDAIGNLYGTMAYGGTENCSKVGCGVVFEISP